MNKRTKQYSAFLPFLTLFMALNAGAQSEVGLERLLAMSMDDLMSLKVRISTNTDQVLSRAPSVVSVITTEDIKATGATNVSEVLQSVPGIFVRPNLFAFRPLVTFRGAASTHTLIMVNGVPMRDLVWSNGIFWKGLPTHMIERIEIIRGPGSALFGSDASAGVVNVITKTAGRIDHTEAGLRVGNFDSQEGWVQHGGNWNGVEYGFTAELSRTDGHDPYIRRAAASESGAAHYGWQGQDLRFSAARGNWRLLADYMGHSDLETGLNGAALLDPLTRGSDYRFDIGLLYSNDSYARDWGLHAELRYRQLGYSSGDGFQERPKGFNCTAANSLCDQLPGPEPEPASGIYPDGWINRQRSAEQGMTFEVSGLYTGFKKHAIRVGAGYNWEDLYSFSHHVNYGVDRNGIQLPAGGPLVDLSDSNYSFMPERSRHISYLFLQDIWTMADDWELTAGLRYNHYSDFGNALNPRLALVWKVSDRLTVKLMYGEAFRAPSFLELYNRGFNIRANPSLTPEESSTWDLSFSYAPTKRLALGLNLYKFSQTNTIRNVGGQYQNSGSSANQGAELEVRWQMSDDWHIAGSLSHVNMDKPTVVSLTAPEDQAYLRLDWAFRPRWSWDVQATRIGERVLQGRQTLEAYTLVDTTIRYAPRGGWQFSASLRNLLDADAAEYTSAAITNNLPLPGRAFHAELAYRF